MDKFAKDDQMYVLDTTEIDILIKSVCNQNGGASLDDMVKVVEWAQKVRVETVLFDLVVEGKIDIRCKNGKIEFAVDRSTFHEPVVDSKH